MKRLVTSYMPLWTVMLLFFLLAACSSGSGPALGSDENDVSWSKLKSPDGRCYQVVTFYEASGNAGFGYMGMDEIPCDDG